MGAIHRFRGTEGSFAWDGIEVEPYDLDSGHRGTRQVVVGPDEGARNFAIRYFEIAPGGKSSLDEHPHDHGVLILKGRGRVRLGKETHSIGFGDVVYVSPNEIHQFENPGPEPLGFLCVIPPKQ